MKVHEAVAGFLTGQGVDVVFGLLGEANMLIVHDLVHRHGVRYVAATREDGAVMMADGYVRTGGRIGVAMVTHGPALTNAMTAITEACRHGTALLVFTAYTPVARPWHQQALDIDAAVAPTGARLQRIRSATTVAEDLTAAYRLALLESRPVVVVFPIEIMEDEVAASTVSVGPVPVVDHRPGPAEPDLDRVVGVLATARRPIVLAGRGAHRSGSRDRLLALAERLGAPVATTLLAKGMFKDEPFDLGIFGTFSSDTTTKVIDEADCVLAFGASLNEFTTERNRLTEGKAVIQVDIDPTHIGRFGPVAAHAVGDARRVAEDIHRMLDEAEVEPAGFRSDRLRRYLADNRASAEFDDQSTAETVDMRTVVARVNELLPRERTVVSDGGRFMVAPVRYLEVPSPRHFAITISFGAIGLGLAAAVGAAAARRGHPVVAVVGDGGFAMSLAEFTTAVRYQLDLVVIVINDRSYGVEYHHYLQRGRTPEVSLFDWPDFAEVARAFGGHGVVVKSLADLDLLETALGERGSMPLLVDVRIDPDVRVGVLD